MRAIAMVVAAAFLVAGCGTSGRDEGGERVPAQPTTPATTVAPAPEPTAATPTTERRNELFDALLPTPIMFPRLGVGEIVTGTGRHDGPVALELHSCAPVDLPGMMARVAPDGVASAIGGEVFQIVVAGDPAELHEVFVEIAERLAACTETPRLQEGLEGLYLAVQSDLDVDVAADEAVAIGYGLDGDGPHPAGPFCRHRLALVRDDDRLMVITDVGLLRPGHTTIRPGTTDDQFRDLLHAAVEQLAA